MTKIEHSVFGDQLPGSKHDHAELIPVFERLSNELGVILPRYLQAQPTIKLKSSSQLKFADWSKKLKTLNSFSLFRLQGKKGVLLVRLDESMIAAMMEVHFGATLRKTENRYSTEFHLPELAIIRRLTSAIITNMSAAVFGDDVGEPEYCQHKKFAKNLNFAKPSSPLFSQSIEITIPEIQSWQMEVVCDADMQTTLLEAWIKKNTPESYSHNVVWQRQWQENLWQAPLQLRTVIAQPVMSVPDLFELAVGDFIPLTAKAKPPLFVEGHKLAVGTLGEQNGVAAYQIDQIHEGVRK